MPFINISTNKTISADKQIALKSELGKTISIIPEKSEEVLMIKFRDQCDMYFGGQQPECCYMNVNLHHAAPMEKKSEFIEKAFKVVESTLGLEEKNIFITIAEFSHWGANGKYLG